LVKFISNGTLLSSELLNYYFHLPSNPETQSSVNPSFSWMSGPKNEILLLGPVDQTECYGIEIMVERLGGVPDESGVAVGTTFSN